MRAARNFGVTDIRLVNPATADPHTISVSAPRSEELIAQIKRYATLDDAVKDCVRVIGTSARGRRGNWPVLHPSEAAQTAHAAPGKVAFLFGREDWGLSNEAMDRCDAMINIPTNPDYSSLNLGQAVLLVLWECFNATGAEVSQNAEFPLASREQVERMLGQAITTLDFVEYFKSGGREHVIRSIRSVFLRAALDERELAIWFGLWKEIPAFFRRTQG